MVEVLHGDCVELMRGMPDCSVDAIVTDPPYGLEFMGKDWDAPWKAGEVVEVTDAATNGTFHTKGFKHGVRYSRGRQEMLAFQEWFTEVAAEALRVLKPGGHLLAFGGTRTYHRMACAIEDAGFEIRDSIHWVYGSGFPKSLNIGKAIDKRGGAVAGFEGFRDAVKEAMTANGVSRAALQDALGNFMLSHYLTAGSQPAVPNWRDYQIIRDTVSLGSEWDDLFRPEAEREVVGRSDELFGRKSGIANETAGHRTVGGTKAEAYDVTAPATDEARRWEGWGTALKPAHEPVVVARKPLSGTVAGNVLVWGTGGLNIDGCRVGTTVETWPSSRAWGAGYVPGGDRSKDATEPTGPVPAGRWPANVVFDTAAGQALDEQSGERPAGTFPSERGKSVATAFASGRQPGDQPAHRLTDSGGASRFFTQADFGPDDWPFVYQAKPSRKERNAGLDGLPERDWREGTKNSTPRSGQIYDQVNGGPTTHRNNHPTVKPVALMRHLVRLVTPPGGTVLDPFAGSGTTLVAAILEGFDTIGCEMTDEYLPIIQGRIEWAQQQAAAEPPRLL